MIISQRVGSTPFQGSCLREKDFKVSKVKRNYRKMLLFAAARALKKQKYIFSFLFTLVFLITLYWGLWPFNFNTANGVKWLETENGIFFHGHGIVIGPSKLNDFEGPPLFRKNQPFSIEFWLTPARDDDGNFSSIFRLYDEKQKDIFSFSQVKSLLNLTKYQYPKNGKNVTYSRRWIKDALLKGERRFITVTSDNHITTVYLDGKKARQYQNYSITPAKDITPTGRMVIGNDRTGKKSWFGKIQGMAIYGYSLSSQEASNHFKKWRAGSFDSLLKEKGLIALYPMDEKSGYLIHNVLDNRYNLLIPDRFKILKKDFLKLYQNNFGLNDSNLRDVRINIFGFIPFGYFLFMILTLYKHPLKNSVWRLIILSMLGGIVMSLIIETLQVYLPSRYSSLADLVSNTTGTGIGIIIALVYVKLKDRFDLSTPR